MADKAIGATPRCFLALRKSENEWKFAAVLLAKIDKFEPLTADQPDRRW